MAYNETPTRVWDRETPRDGLLLQTEFARIYDAIANYIVANGGSAPPLTMKQIADTGVFDTGNKTIAGTKTFSSKITGDISGHADGDVALTGDQTIAGTKTFSSAIAASLNVPSSGTIKHNGENIIGYLDDGTPLYSKVFSGSFASGSVDLNFSHGISNAYTNSRILSVTPHISSMAGSWYQPCSRTDSTILPIFSYYSDTIIGLQRGSTGFVASAMIFIIYR